MTPEEFASLKQEHPKLASSLELSYKAEDITILNPKDDPNGKYSRLCTEMRLEKPPILLIINQEKLREQNNSFTIASYYYDNNAIHITKNFYDYFLKDHPYANYVMHHEAGHAKDYMTRRGFHRAVTTGTISTVLLSLIGQLNLVAEFAERRNWGKANTRIALTTATPPAFLNSLLVAKKFNALFKRNKEKAADLNAMGVVGAEQMISSLRGHIELEYEKEWGETKSCRSDGEFISHALHYMLTNNIQISAEDLELCHIVYLANHCTAGNSFFNRLLHNYPASSERVKNLTPHIDKERRELMEKLGIPGVGDDFARTR